MATDISLETMSVAEKVRLLESVWESLCAHPGDVQSPGWHRQVLEDRRRRLDDGRATVSAWADAEADLAEGYWFCERQSPGLGDYFRSCLIVDIDSLTY